MNVSFIFLLSNFFYPVMAKFDVFRTFMKFGIFGQNDGFLVIGFEINGTSKTIKFQQFQKTGASQFFFSQFRL